MADKNNSNQNSDILNIRDPKTRASILPQYNILNIMYRLYTQVFQRLEDGRYPPYIREYIDARNITPARIEAQRQLIADLLDGLLNKEYQRSDEMDYLRKAMADCRWKERFDWEAMSVFDTLASQSMLATWFLTIADLYTDRDIQAQGAGELREIIDRRCKQAVEIAGELLEKQ
jgi:hypothetical protein